MLHHKTQKLELTEQKDMDKAEEQSKHIENIFRDYEQLYQDILSLVPKNREAELKRTESKNKEAIKAAKEIYHKVFKKKDDPYGQYFSLKLILKVGSLFSTGNSPHHYKKLLKQNTPISLLNYGTALTIPRMSFDTGGYVNNYPRAISCFVMVLLLEENIQSVLSKEALERLTEIKRSSPPDLERVPFKKSSPADQARATFYLDLFQSPNNMEKNNFYNNYLDSNGSDPNNIEFFEKVYPSVMPETTRIKLLALLEKKKEFILEKKKEFIAKEKQADKKVDNKQVETKIEETKEEETKTVELKEGLPASIPTQSMISTLPTQSIFAPTNLSDRQLGTPNPSVTKEQLKSEINQKGKQILYQEEQILIAQKALFKMQEALFKEQEEFFELKSKLSKLKNQEFPPQELRPSTTTMQSN